MNWIVAKIKWIMLVCGALTCAMLVAAVAPQAALRFMFGESLAGPVAEILVRDWAMKVTLVGALLIYGAYAPPARRLILVVTGLSKVILIGLALAYGRQYLGHPAGMAMAADAVMVVLFALYLLGVRGGSSRS